MKNPFRMRRSIPLVVQREKKPKRSGLGHVTNSFDSFGLELVGPGIGWSSRKGAAGSPSGGRGNVRKMMTSEKIYTTFLPVVQII
jgi:hypothetical protein